LNEHQAELLADEVLAAFGQSKPPILFEPIAAEEGIELVEGDFGDEFQGRIEFLQEVRTFAVYHPKITTSRYPPRVRFSIAHEFGHYYIPEHREMLLHGIVHNSLDAFRHQNQMEREADAFAAALLVPSQVLKARMGRRGFLSLQQILRLAEDCQASAQATAFRYTRFTAEPHLAIISEKGLILHYFVSDEAGAIGFAGLGNVQVPAESATMRTANNCNARIEEGASQTERWFSDRQARANLWEEAMRLGSSDRIITLLSWVDYHEET